ncbi:MAG: hypothetical protein M3R17_07680 [Bacteroidota bacterium]|nr:hypothetical protein [Bacteroidota bacterium]
MKKSTLLIAALAFGATAAFAQDLTSKKGENFLPEAGDWSIGIDATPVLNYVGNMFNGNTFNNAPTWDFLNANQTIIGKMYASETMAYRAILRIGISSTSDRRFVQDDAATAPTFPNTALQVEDKYKRSSNFIGLGGGLEWRRGKTRLQGFYGADAMFWMSGAKDSYTYGNDYTATNSNPTTTNFGTGNTTPAYSAYPGRVISEKTGTLIGFGVRGFIGAEYFIVPKISIGAEFGWGFGFTQTGEGRAEVESQDASNPSAGVMIDYTTTGKQSALVLDVDRNAFGTANGSLRLNFHF